MPVIASTHQQIENSANLLRAVFQRSALLPIDAQKKAIRICLAYQLKDSNSAAAIALLNGLYASLGGADELTVELPQENFATGNLADNHQLPEVKAMLAKWIKRLAGQDVSVDEPLDTLLQHADALFDELNNELHETAKKQKFLGHSMLDLLARVKQRSDDNEDALNQAANESFNRLLTSLNPDSAESYLDSSKIKIGPFHKAAMFDALIEKYQQLKAYHEKGRLVRDFKGMYRTHLGQIAKEKSGD